MPQDPVLTVLKLLNKHWDNANTSIGYDPEIHSGWHVTEANSPQVTISPIDEGVERTGTSPFTAFDPDGSGPVQDLSGKLAVNCWSDREVESGANPKKLTYEMSEEVARIVKGNIYNATDLRYIGYGGRRQVVDQDAEPVVFRYEVRVAYGYQRRP